MTKLNSYTGTERERKQIQIFFNKAYSDKKMREGKNMQD